MGGRMQQAGPTQDSTGNLEGKFMCTKSKLKSMGDDASSDHHVATNDKKVCVKRHGQVVGASKSSHQETSEEHQIFSCSSCPRKFSSQYAMAGHRNIHRSEWESTLEDEGKIQRPKLPCNLKPSDFLNTTIALKQESPGNSSSTLSNTLSTIHRPLPCALPYPLANPKNTLKGPSPRYPSGNHRTTLIGSWPLANPTNALKGPPRYPLANSLGRLAIFAPRCHLVNPVNTLKETSPRHPFANPTNNLKLVPSPRYILTNPTDNTLVGSHHTFVHPTKTLMKPLVADLTHPLDRKSELGVRHLSMIHKPCRFRHADLWSTSFGGKQMLKGNIRRFGNNFHLNFLSTAKGASSSSPEGGANREVRDLLSSSCQSRGGKGIEEHDPFAYSQPKERHNCGIYHSSEGLATQRDNNGVNESSLDINLDLTL